MTNKNTSIRFVNAGAGSGKTTELVAIFCEQLIGKEIDRHTGLATGKAIPSARPDSMLLTTYTKAAASEFKEKIKKSLILNSRADLVPDIDSAMIGTIDSICEKYMRRYWYLLGMSPDMEVKQTEEVRTLLAELLNGIVSEQEIQFFNEYTDQMSVTKPGNGGIPEKYYDFWKDDIIDLLNESEAYALNKSQMDMSLKLSLANLSDLPASNLGMNELQQAAATFRNYMGSLTRYQDQAEESWKTYFEPCTIGQTPDTDKLLNFIKWHLGAPKYILKGSQDFFDIAVDIISPVLAQKYRECCKKIYAIAKMLRGKFDAYKRENNIITYSDLESKFLELLSCSEVQSDLSETFKYIMVDEFQDINFVQMRIYEKLCELVDHSCWVGDPKQSIYGFRGSNSALLNQVVKQFPPVPVSKGNIEDELLLSGVVQTGNICRQTQKLGTSHRSLPALVEKVNQVFTPALSQPNIVADEALTPSEIQLVPYTSGFGELQKQFANQSFIHCLPIDGKNKDEYSQNFAEKIRTLVEGKTLKVADRGASTLRDIRYGDIAVLTDSNHQCGEISSALAALGIPVTSLQKNITEQAEIALVLAMLSYVMNGDKLSLLEIGKLWNGSTLDDNLRQAEGWDVHADHSGTIYGILDSIREDKSADSIYNILRAIVSRCDLYHYVARWADADKRKRNLDTLLVMAEEFNSGNYGFSADDFKTFVAKNESEQEFSNVGDTVKVLTYHKAKGLEWKVVLMNSLDLDWIDKFNTKSYQGVKPIFINLSNLEWQTFETNAGMALGTLTEGHNLVYIPRSMVWPDEMKSACKHRSSLVHETLFEKEKAERVRLMYVAFTRAENHIVLLKNTKKTAFPLLELLNENVDSYPVLSCPSVAPSATVQEVPMMALADAPGYNPRKLNPSKVGKHGAVSSFQIEDTHVTAGPVDLSVCPGLDDRILGTCVHNFMANHRWSGQGSMSIHHDYNLALAQRLLHAFSMDAVNAEALVRSADEFRTFLENKYGSTVEVRREEAMKHYLPNGQYVDGEIDLLLSYGDANGKHHVIVDYKNVMNFSAKDLLKHTQNYLPQLCMYRDAVLAANAGTTVDEMYIFYPTLGNIMRIFLR